MLKKGFLITPIVFIIFFLIAVAFSNHILRMDKEISKSIQIVSSIEKGMHEIEKMKIAQISFVKVSTYLCSKENCYPNNKSEIVKCVEENLTKVYGEWDWNYDIYGSEDIFFEFNMTQFKATDINMTSNSILVKGFVNKKFLNLCD